MALQKNTYCEKNLIIALDIAGGSSLSRQPCSHIKYIATFSFPQDNSIKCASVVRVDLVGDGLFRGVTETEKNTQPVTHWIPNAALIGGKVNESTSWQTKGI